MLTERAELLLRLLLDNQAVNLKDTATLFNVSERTLRNDIALIEDYLKAKKLGTLEKELVVELSLSGDIPTIKQTLQKAELDSGEIWVNPHFRQGVIFSQLIWNDSRKITIPYLESILNVSKSSVNSDLKKLRDNLAEENIALNFEKKNGFQLEGSEDQIRDYYFSLLAKYPALRSHTVQPQLDEWTFLSDWLESIEEGLRWEIAFDDFERLLLLAYALVYRIKNGHTVVVHVQSSILPLEPWEEALLQKKMAALADFFGITIPNAEQRYFWQKLQESYLERDELLHQGYKIPLNLLVSQFIERLSQKMDLDLRFDQELQDKLALHFQSSMSGNSKNIADLISLDTAAVIQATYPDIFHQVQQTYQEMSALAELSADEKESAFLTLHVVAALERLKGQLVQDMKVLLICHMGVGTSQFLNMRLKHHFLFQTSAFAKVFFQHNRELERFYDLIITTIDLDRYATSLPIIKVNPYLSERDIVAVQKAVDNLANQRLIDKYRFTHERSREPLLKDLLTDETIALQLSATDWEDAIHQGGKLLENTGSITPAYIDAMIAAVKEFGPYIVIAPGIALAHASSKDGVQEIGMSLSVLAQGVEFGNAQYDPVDLLICLAAVDHNSHLKAMASLVELLNDAAFLETVRTTKDKAAIITYIHRHEEKLTN